MPRERVDAFRAAFGAMLRDEAFLAEIGKNNTPVAPLGGKALQDAVMTIMEETPKDAIAGAAKVYADILAQLAK